jgi:hypothetical protein
MLRLDEFKLVEKQRLEEICTDVGCTEVVTISLAAIGAVKAKDLKVEVANIVQETMSLFVCILIQNSLALD